jgi:hypothetical protein
MAEHLGSLRIVALTVFLIAGVVAVACGGRSPLTADTPAQVADGIWGGTGAQLDVKGAAVSLELDCAHGTLQGPLTLDAQHSFAVAGALVPERPGPQGDDDGPPPQDARYSGQVEGDRLTLTLRTGDDQAGPFTLTHGQPGRLRKCR